MDHGGSLTLQTRREDRALRVTIIDTGRGMPAAIKERIFDGFFSTKPGGHGLGLAIVRAIVTRCGGRFVLEAAPGGGTVARLSLPLTATARPEFELPGAER